MPQAKNYDLPLGADDSGNLDLDQEVPYGDVLGVEKILNTRFKCYVRDLGRKYHKEGHWTIGIIVGKKANPEYNPRSELSGQVRASKLVGRLMPDVRIIHIPGNAAVRDLVDRVERIRVSLPQHRPTGAHDRTITSIEGDPRKHYGKTEPSQMPTLEEINHHVFYHFGIGVDPYQGLDPHVETTAAAEKTPASEGTDHPVTEVLEKIAGKLEAIDQRLQKVEEKKKLGRPSRQQRKLPTEEAGETVPAAEAPNQVIQA